MEHERREPGVEGWNLTGARAGSSAAGQRPSARRSGGSQGGFPWEGPDTPAAASRDDDALSVSQAVELAAGALDALPTLTVIGEVTGFRGPNARSGHCYFQIKDDGAAVDCIIWRGVYGKRSFDLRDGMQVQFTGNFNLYKPTGRMSFVAKTFSLAGEGLLRQQVAALAEKLRREGLMDEARKRPIPAFCTRVAVVTSLSGAVIDDVKRTLRRRNPLVELVCVGAKVQGEGAPAELISGLGRAAAMRPAPDCILLVRGGGSYEDLMTFNDEALARAVASCPVPVVTGIGHEPDTSICDMVSDRRCSTPTAAAESVAPAMSDLADLLSSRGHRLALAASSRVEGARVQIEGLDGRISNAMASRLKGLGAALDAAASRPCLKSPQAIVERRRAELAQTADRLSASTSGFEVRGHALALASERLANQGRGLVRARLAELASSAASLEALSPLKVLARGYAIAYGESGVATRAASFAPGAPVRVRMADGDVYGSVTKVEMLDARASQHE